MRPFGPPLDKDQIIKRQAIEIACLSARLRDQDELILEKVQQRTADLLQDSQEVIDELKFLRNILRNVLKSLRVLYKDEHERLKFLTNMEIVDEAWYRTENPDVAENYPRGALHHYCNFGIFEGRRPNRLVAP